MVVLLLLLCLLRPVVADPGHPKGLTVLQEMGQTSDGHGGYLELGVVANTHGQRRVSLYLSSREREFHVYVDGPRWWMLRKLFNQGRSQVGMLAPRDMRTVGSVHALVVGDIQGDVVVELMGSELAGSSSLVLRGREEGRPSCTLVFDERRLEGLFGKLLWVDDTLKAKTP